VLAASACALILVVVPSAAHAEPAGSELGAKLARQLKTLKHDRDVIRFFVQHPWLMKSERFKREAHRQVSLHRRSMAVTLRRIARISKTIKARLSAQRVASITRLPRGAICRVFGARYCRQALTVARCESHLKTWARNGEYLGLFQMGSTERRLYGHGATALAQARAAHRYFVRSGRDWSPWTCKPW
jgi:hypothetical protein